MTPIMQADGYDHCIIGVAERGSQQFLVYDKEKILETLMIDMTYEEALEHYEFNIHGSWLGNGTPAFVDHDLTEFYGF